MHSKRKSQGHQQCEARQASEAKGERGRRRADLDFICSLMERENHQVQRAAQWYDVFAVNKDLSIWIPGILELYVTGRIALDLQHNILKGH